VDARWFTRSRIHPAWYGGDGTLAGTHPIPDTFVRFDNVTLLVADAG
jgi:hypothetical protein